MEWVEAVAALSDDEAECMRDFHAQAMFLMMKHIVSGSPLLWAVCVVWVVFHVAVIKSTIGVAPLSVCGFVRGRRFADDVKDRR